MLVIQGFYPETASARVGASGIDLVPTYDISLTFPKSEMDNIISMVQDSLMIRAFGKRRNRQYVEIDSLQFTVVHRYKNLEELRDPEFVRISGVFIELNRLILKWENERLGNGETLFVWPEGRRKGTAREFRILVTRAFQTEEPDLPQFVGNKSSKIYHSVGSNHLPVHNLRQHFKSREEAKGSEYKQCPFCFPKGAPVLADWELENQLGFELAATFLHYYPSVINESHQLRARQIGQRVLDNWMFPLQGYEYNFSVVEDSRINAVACPAGRIFLTSGLVESLESDEELESVIAHEIAHVERRHGFRQYKSANKSELAGLVFSALAGVAAGVATDNAHIGAEVAEFYQAITSFSNQVILSGHSRDYEAEADLLVCSYFERAKREQGRLAFLTYLKKLKYLSEFQAQNSSPRIFAMHPSIAERIEYVERGFIEFFGNRVEIPLVKKGEQIGILRLVGQIFYRKKYVMMADAYRDDGTRLKLFATVITNEDLDGKAKIKSLSMEDVYGEKWKLVNNSDDEFYPNRSSGIILDSKGNVSPLLFENVSTKVEID